MKYMSLLLAALMAVCSMAYADLDQGNDACPGTVELALFVDTGTTVGRVSNFSCSCVYGSANSPDVIYEYTPPVTYDTYVSLCGSDFDTGLSIRTGGGCPGTTEIACNDDSCGTSSGIRLFLNSGQTYWIIVDGYNGAQGNYQLSVVEVAPPIPRPPRPVNDLVIQTFGDTLSLHWSPVTTDINGNPTTVYTYYVFAADSLSGPRTFLGTAVGTDFVRATELAAHPQRFYFVTAVN